VVRHVVHAVCSWVAGLSAWLLHCVAAGVCGVCAGCGGGLMDWAFQWIQKNGGIDTEEDWGYYSGWGFGTWCNARKQKDRWVRAPFWQNARRGVSRRSVLSAVGACDHMVGKATTAACCVPLERIWLRHVVRTRFAASSCSCTALPAPGVEH
jgi:hypothetical protein